jgi:hypothetical protein
MRLYEPGYKLQENEYLLKIRTKYAHTTTDTGFLTKLTQKGELPKSFIDWGKAYDYVKREYTSDQQHTLQLRELASWQESCNGGP